MPKQSQYLTRIKEDLKSSFINRPRFPAIHFENGQWQYESSISAVLNAQAFNLCKRLNGGHCETKKASWAEPETMREFLNWTAEPITPGHDEFCCCGQCLGLEFYQKEKND